MNVQHQIDTYLSSLPDAKAEDLRTLMKLVRDIDPRLKLWFLDGRNSDGKVVTNPNIGFGVYTINYADGTKKEFYQIGLSANTTGISIYVMGLSDKKYLSDTYDKTIGKAKVSGYCIKFRRLNDLNSEVLLKVLEDGMDQSLRS